jgi:hypothetical protein
LAIYQKESRVIAIHLTTYRSGRILAYYALKGNIEEIHNRLAVIDMQVAHMNVEIKYTEREKKAFNTMSIEGLTFSLASDTNELVRVGQEMHICVGSYRDKALSKNCTIIIARDLTLKPVICIEVDMRTYSLIQAKAVCNNLVQEHKAEALKKWVEVTGLETLYCEDYAHIASGNIQYEDIYKSNVDYHNIEIDDNDNIIIRTPNFDF